VAGQMNFWPKDAFLKGLGSQTETMVALEMSWMAEA
jgi:hypothetical protein